MPSDNLTFTPSPTIHQSTGDHQQTTDSSLALNKSQDPRSESSTRRLAMTLIIVSIVGSLLGIILLALFGAYAGYRYRTRNEGSYKIENNRSYGGYEICSLKPSNPAVKPDRTLNGRVKNSATKDRKRNQEWYVWIETGGLNEFHGGLWRPWWQYFVFKRIHCSFLTLKLKTLNLFINYFVNY